MRFVLLAATLAAALQQPLVHQIVPVGAGYEGSPAAAAEFERMKSLGLNTVVLRGGMPGTGDQIALARRAGLYVTVEKDGAPPFLDPPPSTSADVRLRAWEAIARGDRAVYFPYWATTGGVAGLLEPDGSVGARARTAGEFAGVISRNVTLFLSLRPRAPNRPAAVADLPGVRVSLLDSAGAMLIVAINHDERAQEATIRFPPDTPEAIWSNLETGAAVAFLAGPKGPSLTHPFLARDVLVLVRSKRLL